MNKKAQMAMVFGLLVVGGIIILSSGLLNKFYTTSTQVVEDNILAKLDEQENNEQNIANKILGFADARLTGSISESGLEYGIKFTEKLFFHESTENTQGVLISYDAPDLTESKNWNLVLVSYKEGVSILYSDGISPELLAAPSDKLYYLANSNLCVLPFNDETDAAAKVLSYVTGLKRADEENIPNKEEVNKIISEHLVDQISLSIGRKSDHEMKYFKGVETYKGISYAGNNGKFLAYYNEGTLCVFPTDSSFFHFLAFDSHVDLDNNRITGKGFIYPDFNEKLLQTVNNNIIK